MIDELEIEATEIYRDFFEGCFEHFSRRFREKYPPGKKGLAKVRKPIVDFCGVGDSSVAEWLSDSDDNKRLPTGEVAIKMKCLLDLNGYRIIELSRLSRAVRNTVELIGFGVISSKKVSDLLGYNNQSNLYAVFRGKEGYDGISKDKEIKMLDLWKEMRDELEDRKKKAAKLYTFSFLQKSAQNQQHRTLLAASDVNGATRRSAVLRILEGSLALLEEGLFDKLSESELAALKGSHGTIVLQLSARLSALGLKLTTGEKE